MVLLLLRYNELGLKSRSVRTRFQNRMIRNIEDKFLKTGANCFIDSDWGRIYLTTDDQNTGLEILTKIFGITSVSPVVQVSDELSEITDTVLEYSNELLSNGNTFAMRTRRTGKHGFTSMELAQKLGKAILDQYPDRALKVNLKNPDVEIFVEVRHRNSYIFSESFAGPGGLPLGTQGKIISLFTDENSFIATWLMMKRGCRAYPVYLSSPNQQSILTEDDATKQVEHLKPWAGNINLKTIELDDSAISIKL
ncbi:MAG: THUMP domain-containing protein [Planctomycetota bacterium]